MSVPWADVAGKVAAPAAWRAAVACPAAGSLADSADVAVADPAGGAAGTSPEAGGQLGAQGWLRLVMGGGTGACSTTATPHSAWITPFGTRAAIPPTGRRRPNRPTPRRGPPLGSAGPPRHPRGAPSARAHG